jgi:hypothetical protein
MHVAFAPSSFVALRVAARKGDCIHRLDATLSSASAVAQQFARHETQTRSRTLRQNPHCSCQPTVHGRTMRAQLSLQDCSLAMRVEGKEPQRD